MEKNAFATGDPGGSFLFWEPSLLGFTAKPQKENQDPFFGYPKKDTLT